MVEVINAAQAKAMIDAGLKLKIVDVREIDEFSQGHIANAINVPLSDLENKAEELLEDKNEVLLVHCRSGKRSAVAAKKLEALGYTAIYDFGGILDWNYETVK